MKVLSDIAYGDEKDIFELEILKHFRDGAQDHAGYRYVCHLVNDFTIVGPNGQHVCLVFELMGETLRSFGARFPESRIPYVAMKRFAIQLILAIDFAHGHNVIHTGRFPFHSSFISPDANIGHRYPTLQYLCEIPGSFSY